MPSDQIFDVLAGAAGRLWEYLALSKPPVDVYVCDLSNELASKIGKDTGTMTPIPGAKFAWSIAADGAGNVFLAEPAYDGILKYPAGGGPFTTLAPDIVQPYSVAADRGGNAYFIGKTYDAGSNFKAIKVPASGGDPEEIWAGSGPSSPDRIAVDSKSNVYLIGERPARVSVLPAGGGSPTSFDIPGDTQPSGFAVDPVGRFVYVVDANSNQVVRVPVGGGGSTVISGLLHGPRGVAVDLGGNVYVADCLNNRVVQVSAYSGRQVTVARTKWPTDVAVAPQPIYNPDLPDLVGTVFGAAAEGGSGWLVIGKPFIPIPPRSPVMRIIAEAAAPYAGRAIESAELAEMLDKLQSRPD